MTQLPLFAPVSPWRPPNELPRLAGAKRIAIDCETRDEKLQELGPGVRRGAYIVGLAIGTDSGFRGYFPVRHEGTSFNLSEEAVKRWARAELNAFRGEIVGANILYDLDFLAEWGVTFPNVSAIHDVLIAEPLIDEWRRSYSLDEVAKTYVGVGKEQTLLSRAAFEYGWKTEREIKRNIWRLPAEFVGPYAEGDVDLPLRIFPEQLKRLEAEGLEAVYGLERRLIPVLLAMRRRGIRVDIPKAREVRKRLSAQRDQWLAKVRRIAGPKAEFMAPASFYKALEERGLRFPRTVKTNQPSITKAWLKQNESDELVHAVQQGRRLDTTINTFIDGHVFTHSLNGRIFPQFNQLKSDEGGTIARLSSSTPNVQQISARDPELGPLIRSIFVPDNEDKWESIDLSQIEWRYLAHYAIGSGSAEARRKYNEDPNTDFHVLCAEFLGVDTKDEYLRKMTKNSNFCRVYGGGVRKIAETAGITIEEAAKFIETYDRELPFVRATYDKAMKVAEARGYVTTVYGRRQRFSLWEPRVERATPLPEAEARKAYGNLIKRSMTHAALNRVLQGSAADHMKKAMVDVWESGVCDVIGPPLATIHDELCLSRPDTPAGIEAAREVKRIMETAIKLRVPVLAKAKSGPSWGACA